MNRELRALINDFRATQDLAIDYLHSVLLIPLPKSGPDWVRNGHRTVREAAERVGSYDIKLSPHGFGIDIIHPNFRIDFDYGPNGEIDCFDVWRLAWHRHQSMGTEPAMGPYDDIREWIHDAVDKDELLTVPDSFNAFFQDPTMQRSSETVRNFLGL